MYMYIHVLVCMPVWLIVVAINWDLVLLPFWLLINAHTHVHVHLSVQCTVDSLLTLGAHAQ